MGIARAAIMIQTELTPERATEATLLARCRDGDLEAFGRVYALHERAVFRYAYGLLGHREDADDIKQETFLRAHKAICKFRGDSGVQTWLFRICGNLCRDRIKSWDRRNLAYDGGDAQEWERADERSDPAHLVEKAELSAIVWRALGGLPPAHREVMVLHEVEELDYAAIAEIIGCSKVSVKLRVFRARKMLKERVEVLLQ